MRGAHIGGQLIFSGATLTNPDGYALNVNGLTVDQDMFCEEEFTATGEVNLVGAHIGSSLSFSGATLTNPDGYALSAFAAHRWTGTCSARRSSPQPAEVSLVGAHIGGSLSFRRANPEQPRWDVFSTCRSCRPSALFLRGFSGRPIASRHSLDAEVGTLLDDPASWPREAVLDGFIYNALYEDRLVRARQRLDWLASNRYGYSPQPYEQLAAVYHPHSRPRSGCPHHAPSPNSAPDGAPSARPSGCGAVLLDGLVGCTATAPGWPECGCWGSGWSAGRCSTAPTRRFWLRPNRRVNARSSMQRCTP